MNDNLNQANLAIQKALETTAPEKCEKCGSIYFKDVVVLKTINKLMSPTGEDMTVPISLFVCDKCGELAPSLKNDEKLKKVLNLNNVLIN